MQKNKNKIIEIRKKNNLKNVALMITKVWVTFCSYYQRDKIPFPYSCQLLSGEIYSFFVDFDLLTFKGNVNK